MNSTPDAPTGAVTAAPAVEPLNIEHMLQRQAFGIPIAKKAADRAAAAAPDKAKLEAFLRTIENVPIPDLTNTAIEAAIDVERDKFIALVERMIVSLSTPTTKKTLV